MTSEAKRRPVLLVVHSPESRPGQVEEAIVAKGWPTERCCPKAGDTLPEALDGHAGVVIFGGPMSANDDPLELESEAFEVGLYRSEDSEGSAL